jgi:hypothetical protein
MHFPVLAASLLVFAGAIDGAAAQPRFGSGWGFNRFGGKGQGGRGENKFQYGPNKGQNNGNGNGSAGGNGQGNENATPPAQIILNPNLHQPASGLSGQEPGTEGIKPGQAASAT